MQTQSSPIVAYRDHWTSECIALICGIANAGGGTLVIESSEKAYTTGRRKLRRPFEQIPKLVEKELGLRMHDRTRARRHGTVPGNDRSGSGKTPRL